MRKNNRNKCYVLQILFVMTELTEQFIIRKFIFYSYKSINQVIFISYNFEFLVADLK